MFSNLAISELTPKLLPTVMAKKQVVYWASCLNYSSLHSIWIVYHVASLCLFSFVFRTCLTAPDHIHRAQKTLSKFLGEPMQFGSRASNKKVKNLTCLSAFEHCSLLSFCLTLYPNGQSICNSLHSSVSLQGLSSHSQQTLKYDSIY